MFLVKKSFFPGGDSAYQGTFDNTRSLFKKFSGDRYDGHSF